MKKLDEKDLTPAQIARRKYEETHKTERKERNGQFTTFIPRPLYNEINEFLEQNNITKVQLIQAGFDALKEQIQKRENIDKKNYEVK